MVEGMPATDLIDSIFAGVSLAVGDVSNAVDTHSNRLADNPCAWSNELSAKVEGLTTKLGAAYAVAQQIAQAGSGAINSALAVAGFAVQGRQFNSSALRSFGDHLRDNGYPIGPPFVEVAAAMPFVRRGAPRRTYNTPIPGQPGTGLDAQGKLAGPAVWSEWVIWSAYARGAAEPKGPIRRRGSAEGWRAILAQMTGSAAWTSGAAVSPQSLIGQAIYTRDLAAQSLIEAKASCRLYLGERPSASPSPAVAAAGLWALWRWL